MLLSGSLPLPSQAADIPPVRPPIAAKKPKVTTRFGERRVDNYAWLRNKDDPEVLEYLNAENVYGEALMRPLADFRETLYKEMLSRIQETDESVPYRRHGYLYYQREVEGQQYPIYCRRKGDMNAPEEILLDVNALAKGHKFTAIGILDVSPDGTKAFLFRGPHGLSPVFVAREGPRVR
jgi:oligopeptidase B